MIRQGKFPWPILVLIIGAVLLIVILAVLPRAPHITKPPTAAEIPQQPTAEQIQLTNVKLAPAPAGGALNLTALLRNTGIQQSPELRCRPSSSDGMGRYWRRRPGQLRA
jgi:hypothetical protein